MNDKQLSVVIHFEIHTPEEAMLSLRYYHNILSLQIKVYDTKQKDDRSNTGGAKSNGNSRKTSGIESF